MQRWILPIHTHTHTPTQFIDFNKTKPKPKKAQQTILAATQKAAKNYNWQFRHNQNHLVCEPLGNKTGATGM